MSSIHHLAIRVSDCLASSGFYARVFGAVEIRRVEDNGHLRAVWLRTGGTVLMLERVLRGSGPRVGSGHVLVFATEDLAAAENRLQTLGIAVTDRTAATLYFADPDGHRAGLTTHRFEPMAS
jgi:catechol 2,3-dioxygenase-like lactoylglutathione lyase family enzyme